VEIGGVDYSVTTRDTVALIFWPVVVYGASRIVFDLFRAAQPRAVRLTALGDIALAAARGVLWVWLLLWSPIAQALDISSVQAAFERLQTLVQVGDWDVSAFVIIFLGSAIIDSIYRIAISAWRFLTGRDSRLEA
jgi:hypothetical protein